MFRRLAEGSSAVVRIVVDGRPVEARAGDSVAAALLAAGMTHFQPATHPEGPHGPYCMMGACADCLVWIPDVGQRQACAVPVREGMEIVTRDSTTARDA